MKRAIGLALLLAGCATPATVPAVTALVVCIVDRADVDANAQPPMTDTAIAEDVAGYCASDVPTVIATLAARKAERAKAARK